MEWIFPMIIGLILDIIGATLITKSIFSIKSARITLTVPTNLPEKEKKMLKDMKERSSLFTVTSENDDPIAFFRLQIKDILDDAFRHRKNKKYAQTGLIIFGLGLNLQIIANFIIWYQLY